MTQENGNRLFRMTRQRRVILDVLQSMCSHPTADELYSEVRTCLPRISLATVYRNLEHLSAQGLIQKLELAGDLRRFDGNPKPHFHARCTGCGQVFDVFVPDLVNERSVPDLLLEQGKFAESGFVASEVYVEWRGLCRKCAQRSSRWSA